MKAQKSRPFGKQRGVALLAVIALLVVFLIFVGAVMTQLAQEVNSSKTHGVSMKALAAADAGVRAMVVVIEENIAAGKGDPGSIGYSYPEPAGPPTTSYNAKILNSWLPQAFGGSRFYLIESDGTVNTGVENQTRVVRAIVRAQSLAQFASFSNYESNQFGKTVWYTPNQHFDGLVYSGGPMHVEYDTAINKNNPIFGRTVQTVLNPVFAEVQGGVPVDDGSDWSNVVNGGMPNFGVGVQPLGLPQPQKDVLVASEAFYGKANQITNTYPTCGAALCMNQVDATSQKGVPLTTGMFITGNVAINATSAGSQETFTITALPPSSFAPYTVVVDFGAKTTKVTSGGNTGTFTGVPSGDNGPGMGNGALFVNGDATLKLGSVIQGQYTLAVPDYKGDVHNIFLKGNGSITYNDPSKDQLGLWANDVIVSTNSSDITIDADIIAGWPGEPGTDGGFYNAKCTANGCGGSSQGTLTINGGLAENMRGALGKFFAGGAHTGFDRKINYDTRFTTNPPPFNPVDGAYDVVGWEDMGSF